MPSHPSPCGSVPEKRKSGRIAKIGLRARTGPTIEMSPPAVARTSRYDIAEASTTEASTHGHIGPVMR